MAAASPWLEIDQQPQSAFGGIAWKGKLRCCDPYLVWADVVSVAPPAADPERLIPLLIERRSAGGVPVADGLYPTHLRAWNTTRFLPCVATPGALHKLVDQVVQGTGEVLRLEHSGVRAVEASTADEYKQLYRPLKVMGEPPIPNRQMQQAQSQPRPYPALPNGALPLLCVIDDRCAFASPRLRAPGGPLVAAVWHQGRSLHVEQRLSSSRGWSSSFYAYLLSGFLRARGALFGRYLSLYGDGRAGVVGEEVTSYARTGYLDPLPSWSHGSAVVHTIAGGPGAKVPAGRIVFAQLPSNTVNDTTGGSLAAHVLDAIHDAIDLAKPEGARPQAASIVVNLSFGHHGGPHDGSSMFEQALCELLGQHPDLHVVLPAGNTHLARVHCGGWVMPASPVRLQWKVLPDNPVDSFLEIWFDRPCDVQIEVKPPAGAACTFRTNQARAWTDAGGVRAALIFPPSVAQGRHGSMALLALSPTRRAADAAAEEMLKDQQLPGRRPGHAEHGVWTVTLCSTAAVRFDAWAQRGDVAPGREQATVGPLGRQSRFLDAPEDPRAHPDPRMTLNGIATASRPGQLWVVGAMRIADRGLSTYSAAGPNRLQSSRCEGPDAVVPADDSLALPGLRTSGLLGSSRVRLGGTSLAAAVFTRQLYAHLASPKAHQPFVWHPMTDPPTTRPRVAAGDPEPAAPVLRGDFMRMDPALIGMHSAQAPAEGRPTPTAPFTSAPGAP